MKKLGVVGEMVVLAAQRVLSIERDAFMAILEYFQRLAGRGCITAAVRRRREYGFMGLS